MLKIPAIYPDAIQHDPDLTPGDFFAGGGQPQGIVIHYTADRDLDRVMRTLREKKEAYHLIVDRDGGVHQMAYLTTRVDHAGKSKWREHRPNQTFLGIAAVSWGKLDFDAKTDRLFSWAKTEVSMAEAIPAPYFDRDPDQKEFWDSVTGEQMNALADVLIWFAERGILLENICGHDECALPPGRKIDPGGIFQFSMHDLREALSSIWTLKQEAATMMERQHQED